MNFAEQLFKVLMARPEAKNNPMAQELARLVKEKDMEGIEKMGRNLCQTYNTSEEDAKKMAQDWASGFFGGNK